MLRKKPIQQSALIPDKQISKKEEMKKFQFRKIPANMLKLTSENFKEFNDQIYKNGKPMFPYPPVIETEEIEFVDDDSAYAV
jgi:protein tyrosine phosphatase (PTP) superfamily phosphohydrolase (DUF442 family)